MTKAIAEPTPQHARCWADAVSTLLARNGWSDADLARKLHAVDAHARRLTSNRQSLERSVANWRRGAQLASRRAVITLLAAVGTPEELQAGTIMAGSDLHLLDQTLERMGVLVLTRRQLLNAAATTAVGAATY